MAKGEFNPARYWEERLNRNYNLTGVGYLPMGEGFNHWMYRVRSDVFARHVGSLDIAFDACSALDIGSGTGFYIRELEKLGVKDISGVDLTETATRNLAAAFPAYRFFQADIGDKGLQIGGAPFDVVTCFDVLFHIVDDARYQTALGNIFNLTAAGGYFIFSDNLTPARQEAEHHISRSEDEVRAALAHAGFEIVAVYPMFHLMNAPVSAASKTAAVYWKGLQKVASMARHLKLDYLIGALLYPVESVMLRRPGQGISTKLLICKKPG